MTGSCSFFLCCFAFLLLLFGLLRFGPFSPGWVSPLVLPSLLVAPLVPSGPVSVLLVPPSRYLVVFATARLLSSLLLMATKASALCGVLPSTPCNGCCSGALFFGPSPLPFGGSTVLETYSAPCPGGIDPRLAVYARS